MAIPSIRCGLLAAAVLVATLTGDPGNAGKRSAAKSEAQTQARALPAADYPSSIRRPRGIYAVVVVNETRGADKVDFDALVSNAAVSGLAIRTFWSSLQPAKDRYDFSQLDAAFASAEAKHKTIQLIVVPGFGTPAWVLTEIPSCDDMTTAPAATSERGGRPHGGRAKPAGGTDEGAAKTGAASCGKASFTVSEGKAHGEKQELPLPWNPVYKRYWKAFLTEVAARYGKRDALVSIAVAGPTAESVEIILPRSGDQLERWGELLQLFYRDPSYQQSDKAFVDEWDAAVTVYGELFRNVTIVLTRGSGLLAFSRGQARSAQAAIVSSFAAHAVGTNAKATQTSGMKACRETEGGIKGVKELAMSASYAPPVLGGAQFDTSFSQKPATEGCKASCDAEAPTCRKVTPAQALNNVLSQYFDGTPAGDRYGASKGAVRMNYLQIYEKDIRFAGTQPEVQAALEQASRQLLMQAR
ncbi:MAG TPA: beta-galactosidase [Casimicrobiaceae bacterium]|nr:beta-galactosidase [Casimicrobiaceae bacterium]